MRFDSLNGNTVWWSAWALLTLAGAIVLGIQLFSAEQKTAFLPGQTSHGHHQIEMQCTICHGSGFDSADTLQNACMNCHGDELDTAQDAHPRSKFTNPRNAGLLENLDARQCVSCHVEHRPELISAMGVSQPVDVCAHCHQDIGKDRPSHEGMGFDTCQSAGCHNFHDNRALYEDFLLAHADEAAVFENARQPPRNFLRHYLSSNDISGLLSADQALALPMPSDKEVPENWAHSSHGMASVECAQCHGQGEHWLDKPTHQACASCHDREVETFLQGKHGMRLALELSPMTPAQSPLNLHVEKAHTELTCNTCHVAHEFNSRKAAVDKCLGCHNDEHSNEYLRSPHYTLWKKELKGALPPGAGVSCATCHMPATPVNGGDDAQIFVDHNQNGTLRPNEKMIRPVCMNCHGLGFSIDALADPTLIENNFNGQPKVHIPSIDMAIERDQKKGSRNSLYD